MKRLQTSLASVESAEKLDGIARSATDRGDDAEGTSVDKREDIVTCEQVGRNTSVVLIRNNDSGELLSDAGD